MRKSAFTLVELLVVIGIIALLVAMLLPSLNRARESAKQVQCAAQLRQLGQGLMIYANGNKGYFPTWSGWHNYPNTGTGEDDPGPAWSEVLEPYFVKANSPVYNCPSFIDGYPFNYFLGVRWLAMNGKRHLQFSEIKQSTTFVLSGDCTEPRLYPPPFGSRTDKSTTDIDKDDASQEGVLFFGQDGGLNVHRAGNNLLFGDGHVAPVKEFDPHAMTYNPKRAGETWENVSVDGASTQP